MRTIALLTDFGIQDNYVGAMKGVILSINSGAILVDITHQIKPGSIRDAAFLLVKTYRYFPKKTVFLVVIDPGVGSERKALAIKTKNYYFVGPDNGVLAWAAKDDGIVKVVELKSKRYFLREVSSTFHGRDIFAPVSAYLAKGVVIEKLGPKLKGIKQLDLPQPKIKGNTLRGEVIYIDRFGNLVTNIKKDAFLSFLGGRRFIARLNNRRITKICDFYSQAQEDKPFLVEGGFSLLEVSLKNKSAQEYFRTKIGGKIVIKTSKKPAN
jgi:hypothetical protein